jgi:hypothetical protein
MPAIISTLTNTIKIAIVVEHTAAGETFIVEDFTVLGGHGLTDLSGKLLTGTKTICTNEQLALLRKDWTFRHLEKNGTISIDVNEKANATSKSSKLKQKNGLSPAEQSDLDAMHESGEIASPVEAFDNSNEK